MHHVCMTSRGTRIGLKTDGANTVKTIRWVWESATDRQASDILGLRCHLHFSVNPLELGVVLWLHLEYSVPYRSDLSFLLRDAMLARY